ncbi:Kazal-type serine protease inhibitor [Bacteriovorax sp. DB6_IX]|uniref:Kazal-type serine protease inhibitor family protein n=1 Tax=Bacteriovorax sp. DB6_IX TaxID=1353530 RepID=UPI00038A0363|nr:Kazal-type serine protease inhibitor [Bacteriovorax sp. DB6_IX]EQC52107.1 Kazal-type serine protease inhibitor domain protein [Bacteriovorax sp. DB6_IX]
MKNIVLTLFCLLALSTLVRAEGNLVISGRLLDDINLNGRINKMIFTENKTEIRLVNEYNESESCERGSFEITRIQTGVYELKGVISCDQWVDETEEVQACPENFQPVCGEIASDSFGKALPKHVTFSNMCELYRAKAAFIQNGGCR